MAYTPKEFFLNTFFFSIQLAVFFSLFQPDFSKLAINPNSVWQQFVSQMVPEITLVVKFCKKIPGKCPLGLQIKNGSKQTICLCLIFFFN